MSEAPRVLLTIAGTDPSGGAGIQADLQVFRDYGFHGTSVITAVLWQNTQEVLGFRALEADEVGAQLDAVLDDIEVAAVKIGMVPNVQIAQAIATRIEKLNIPIVIDTVYASGSGAIELTTGPTRIASILLPHATIATPNSREAAVLLGAAVDDLSALEAATTLRQAYGCPGLLLKAGHLEGSGDLRDVFASPNGACWLDPLPRISEDVRGTGCQLSSAIAAELAEGEPAQAAVEDARAYLNKLLREDRAQIGKGRSVVVRA